MNSLAVSSDRLQRDGTGGVGSPHVVFGFGPFLAKVDQLGKVGCRKGKKQDCDGDSSADTSGLRLGKRVGISVWGLQPI